jgi:hypothetical protein
MYAVGSFSFGGFCKESASMYASWTYHVRETKGVAPFFLCSFNLGIYGVCFIKEMGFQL